MSFKMGLSIVLCQLITFLYVVKLALSSDGIDPILDGRSSDPIQCYECISYSHMNNFCGDPFNDSHPNVTISKCFGTCVKWVRSPMPGVYRYQRTCSQKLKILMTINLVCMEESRPSTGKICFCKKDGCNGGTSLYIAKILTFIALVFLHTIL